MATTQTTKGTRAMNIGEIEKVKHVELPAREAPAVQPAREPIPRHEPAETAPERAPQKVPAGPAREGDDDES